MTSEEPNESEKCMDAESADMNANKTSNGRLRFGFQEKLRSATPEQRQGMLTALLLMLLLVFFVIIVALAVKVNMTSSDLHGRCYTPECLRSAAYIISNMDADADPCDDFQRFACGGFLRRHELNASLTRVDLLDETRAAIRARTRQLIDEVSDDEEQSDKTVRSHIAKFFESCVDNRNLLKGPNIIVTSFLRQIGGWEAVSATSYEPTSWKFDKALSALMKDYAVFPFFKFEVTLPGQGSRNPMIKISPSGFGLGFNPANYDKPRRPHFFNAYVKFINKVIHELRDGERVSESVDRGENIFHFEDRLLQRSQPHPRNLSRDEVVLPLAELRTLTPTILWADLLNAVFPRSRISDHSRLLLEDVDYFRNLGNVLSTTKDEIKNNYMMWHFIMKYAPFMSKEVRLAEARFHAEIAGGQVDKIDHEAVFTHCLDLTIDFYGQALAHLYRDRFGLADSLQSAEKVFGRIPRTARRDVKTVTWLTEAYYKVMDRFETLGINIGYPDVAASGEKALIYYSDGHTTRNFLDNVVEQNRLRLKWMALAVDTRETPEKRELARQLLVWSSSPLSLRPHYSYGFNQVTVPLGMLSEPIFSSSQNRALQLSAAVLVAQEALKAVDRFGLQFGEHGLTPNATFEALNQRLVCLEKATENELHARGPMNTFVDEAVSDVAGLRVALRMLDDSASDLMKMPGLEYEPRQLFYIGYGQLMCERMTENRLANLNGTLQSAPQRLRLHRTLQQTPDFADTFSCSGSSRMVPPEVCEIW